MTQQYLAGELSVRLAQLQAVGGRQGLVCKIKHLRQEVETAPTTGLASVLLRALKLTDSMCWESLERGDTTTFMRDIDMYTELCEFGVAAGLIDEVRTLT